MSEDEEEVTLRILPEDDDFIIKAFFKKCFFAAAPNIDNEEERLNKLVSAVRSLFETIRPLEELTIGGGGDILAAAMSEEGTTTAERKKGGKSKDA